MDKSIQQLLNEKDENVVQFNLTNTTSNPIYLDLFNTSNLTIAPSSPTYLFQPNSVTGSFGASVFQSLSINPINGYLYATDSTNIVQVYDTNNSNVFVTNIVLPTTISSTTYNSTNNTIYAFSNLGNSIYVIDGNTNTLISTIPVLGTLGLGVFSTINNSIFFTLNSQLWVIDCNTNIASFTGIGNAYSDFQYNPTNNLIYAVDFGGLPYLYDTINPLTNTIVQSINTPFQALVLGNNPNPSSPYNYLADNITGDIYIYDWSNNNSFVGTFSPSIGLIGRSVYNPITNSVYFGSTTGNLLIIDSNNNYQISFIGLSILLTEVINPNNNNLYTATPLLNNITEVTTIGITSNSFYVTGSINYNTFVNNLNNEPVYIQMFRLITQNQNQLTNELQLTTIDSNGNQIFMPNFPINDVSAYQQQGNIGEVRMKDVIFDGRTYINQYKLNAYQTISFEVYYKQLDLTSATPTFPILFKPKVQLAEYLKLK